MPFGLKGVPATFQRLMDKVLAPCTQYASAYLDDIIIFSAEHLQHIRAVFDKLKKAGLKVKGKKCQMAMHSLLLGHVVGGQSI